MSHSNKHPLSLMKINLKQIRSLDCILKVILILLLLQTAICFVLRGRLEPSFVPPVSVWGWTTKSKEIERNLLLFLLQITLWSSFKICPCVACHAVKIRSFVLLFTFPWISNKVSLPYCRYCDFNFFESSFIKAQRIFYIVLYSLCQLRWLCSA